MSARNPLLRNTRGFAREVLAKAQRQVKLQELQAHRLESFTPVIGTDYQCPTCWLMGKHSTMTPSCDAPPDVLFGCGTCGYEITVARH